MDRSLYPAEQVGCDVTLRCAVRREADQLRAGFAECFRVLKPNGTLVFKWNETQVKTREVLALTTHKPLFGQVSGAKGMTHWLVFMKPEAA